MRRLTKILSATCLAVCALVALAAGPAQAAFGLKELDVTSSAPDGSPAMQAGSHPFAFTTKIVANTRIDPESGKIIPDEETKDLKVILPPGLVGTPTPVPRCSAAEFLAGFGFSECPDSTAVGVARIEFGEPGNAQTLPIFNLIPPPGTVAKLGFNVEGRAPVTVDIGLNPNPPYNVIVTSANISQALFFLSAKLTIWGVPADPAHDAQRGSCLASKASCPVLIPEKPFLTLPTTCSGPLSFGFEADSWQNPGTPFPFSESVLTHDNLIPPSPLGISGCANLGFAPQISALPTNQSAESPSGLDFGLNIDDEGLTNPSGIADSAIKKAVVTLPMGMTLNPSVAEGLSTCTKADYEHEALDSEAGGGCPQASKVGNVEVETPLLEGTLLKGSLFVATPDDPATTEPGAENPFDTLIAIYIVIKDPELGIIVKLPGKVTPDPSSGQLIATFDELPQFPFSHFRLHFREGGRSPLITPPACGTYTTQAELTPWSGAAPLPVSSTFKVTSGVNGGPCPAAGVPPFHPGFEAGSINNNAGSYSPFYMRLTRQDGEQDMTHFDATLPPGVIGKLAGVAKCPEAAIEAAKAKTGKQELANPSCPAASQIGHSLAGAGVGSELTYVPGELYLAGPFGGDPLSIVAITPAVAGPFDAGTVVVRVALTIDPNTAEVQIDGAHSDPIPHILKGIPLKLRDLRIYADRPDFTLNPTSCEPSAAKATLFGSFVDAFNSADDVPASLSSRYQAANCASLGFKPKLSLRLKGGTRRGAHPALKAVVTYPKASGYANIGKAAVTLPHSAFLEQAHIRTVCTRVQFNAKQCPVGSIYGHVKATTPLLDEPVEGPVYLRSSDHQLPDLVFALRGIVEVDVVARLDSIHSRIRARLESIPDLPVSKFTLEMQGGKKGLIVNSRDLCAHRATAIADLTGQNGKVYDSNPVVANSCGEQVKGK